MPSSGPSLLIVCTLAMTLAAGCSGSEGQEPDGPLPADDLGQDRSLPDKTADKPKSTRDKTTRDRTIKDSKPGPDTKKPVPDQKPKPDKPITGKGPYRVATFNLYCHKDSPAVRVQGIAAEIKKLNLDALGLQEVCQTAGKGGSDHMGKQLCAELKKITGQDWEYRWTKTHLAWNTHDEGLGVLARKGQIKAWGEKKLYKAGGFQRKVIWAKVATSRGAFYLFSTHLGITSSGDRGKQAADIVGLVSQQASQLPVVIVGDFNDFYGSAAVNNVKNGPPQFIDAWGTKHPGSAKPGLTCCWPNFKSRIDYIFHKKATLANLAKVELAFEVPHKGVPLSDHKGVFSEFYAK